MGYNPGISAWVSKAEDDWGNAEENREHLVPFLDRRWGMSLIDRTLYGINVKDGEIIGIQGIEKSRKTTFAANIVLNICMSGALPDGYRIAIDTLESGMPPERYRDVLISMVATRILLDDVWQDRLPGEGEARTGGRYKQLVERYLSIEGLGITPEFLRYHTRSEQQMWAIEQAKQIVSRFPIDLYGPGSATGDTRSLALSQERWKRIHEKRGVKLLVVDHVQQYHGDTRLSDYQKLERAVDAIANWSTSHRGVAFILSQVSLTSVRQAREHGTAVTAKGGAKLSAEANVVFDVGYEEGANVMTLHVSRSRRAAPPTCYQGLEKQSGLFVLKPFGPVKDFG